METIKTYNMKKRDLKSLRLNKKSISNLRHEVIVGGLMSTPQGCSGSQNDSQCGLSCDPALCKPKDDLRPPLN